MIVRPKETKAAFLESTRRDFLKQASLLFVGASSSAALPWLAKSVFGQQAARDPFPVADTTNGKIRGIDLGGIKTFRGVHYGASTAGPNRFMPPQKVQKWTGVKDCIAYGEISPQTAANPADKYTQMIDWEAHANSGIGEDCLHLNVWTPALKDGTKRPVLFSMHGGGFSTGSGNNLGYSGEPMARFGNCVVVTVNHRLGPFGYTHLGDIGGEKYAKSGVAGMLDLVAALEWVRDNIENFGGDPGCVMIYGQSGGGAKTSTMLGMPSAKGLFHKAAVQSGSSLASTPKEQATQAAERMLTNLGISKNNLAELHNVPWDKLLAAGGGGGPCADGTVIVPNAWSPTAPVVSADIPILVGTTLEDALERRGGLNLDAEGLKKWCQEQFAGNAEKVLSTYQRVHPKATPLQLQARISTDRRGRRSASTMAERKAAVGKAPAYLYVWTWPSPAFGGVFGSVHGMDVGLSFHNARQIISGNTPEAFKMADILSSVWLAFARTGNPNCKEIPNWPAFSADKRETMLFDLQCKVENDPWKETRLLWNELGGEARGARS